MKLLYIAQNIPTPNRKSNRVILDIAKKLQERHEIGLIHPIEKVPFFLRGLRKYLHLKGLLPWVVLGRRIRLWYYWRLPWKNIAFVLAGKSNGQEDLIDKDIQLIHAHYLFPDALIAEKIAQKLNIPFIVTIRESDKKLLTMVSKKSHTYALAKKIIGKTEAVHTLNGTMASLVDRQFSKPCTIIPHGVNRENMDLQFEWKDSSAINLIVVAELIPRKNIDWVIEAVAKNKEQKINLSIIGDGPLRTELQKSARGLPIKFLGKIAHDQVLNYLSDAHLFVLPSAAETFGLVYLEAAAKSCAIIGLRQTGVDGIFPEDAGVFIESKTELFSVLTRLYFSREELCDRAKKCWETACNLGWENQIAQYENLYDRAVDNFES